MSPASPRRLLAIALLAAVPPAARADDVSTLPLGDPQRAYLLGSGEAGQIIDCRLAPRADGAKLAPAAPVTLDALAADLATVDVALIGEHHTNMDGHRTQWKILGALARTNHPFALGMEFFQFTDDDALADFSRGTADAPGLLDRTSWYSTGGYNFEYYRPLLEICREHQAPIYGLNIPRDWVRTVSRQGTEGLTEEQRKYVGDLGPTDERHRYIINQMIGTVGAAMPEMADGMYRGQTTWDAAMATAILRAHRKHLAGGGPRTIVVIVGSGHMGHGVAIPARLHAMDPALKIRTIAPVSAHRPDDDEQVHPGFAKKESGLFSRGYADYVYILPDDGNAEDYPLVGARLEHPKGAASPTALPLRIAGVTPGSVADRAGLRVDDSVLRIGADEPRSPRQAGMILGTLRWNERVEWTVLRANVSGELHIPMLVVPPSDNPGDWLKSRPASTLLDSFDPASARSYAEPKDFKPSGVSARLVTFRNDPVRIDVLRAGILQETWKLDDAGRPVLGLLAAPAADGAVRIEYERDDTGAVKATRRLNAEGAPIAPAPTPGSHADLAK